MHGIVFFERQNSCTYNYNSKYKSLSLFSFISFIHIYIEDTLDYDKPPCIKHEHSRKENHGVCAADVGVHNVATHCISKYIMISNILQKSYQVYKTLIRLKPLCLGDWERQYFDNDSFDGLFTSCCVVVSTHRKRFNDGETIRCRPVVGRSLWFDSREDRTIVAHYSPSLQKGNCSKNYQQLQLWRPDSVSQHTMHLARLCMYLRSWQRKHVSVLMTSFLVEPLVNSGISDLDLGRMEESFIDE